MANEGALDPIAPGPLIRMGQGDLAVDIAPRAGGRIAQIHFGGTRWLVGHGPSHEAMIAWGCFPMLPWAGRIRHGRYTFRGQHGRLPANLGGHAIHGVAFGLPWWVEEYSPTRTALSLLLPEDERWPFGGSAHQLIEAGTHNLRLTLTLTADKHAMPATIGWHPWFRKPDRLDFRPTRCYPRDAEGIAHLPLIDPPPGPWDDCFLNDRPITLQRHGENLRISADSDHWVVFDELDHATCVEPQSGPPDAFNLGRAQVLEPGDSLSLSLLLEWSHPRP